MQHFPFLSREGVLGWTGLDGAGGHRESPWGWDGRRCGNGISFTLAALSSR